MVTETKNLADLLKTNGYDPDSGFAFITSLPASIKRRVKALKKLQIEEIKAFVYSVAPSIRRAIVVGDYEPTDEEADCLIINGLTEEDAKKIEETSAPEPETPTKGIPDFWLNLLKGVDHIAEMIQEHDEPILKHLVDVTVQIGENPDSFTLTFHFTPNEYFKQTELTKWYKLKLTPDEDNIFDYEGPMVVEAKGSEITWNEGKDVTKKVIKKKQKKGSGAGKFVTKTVKNDSFFNFFDPIVIPEKEKGKEVTDDEYDEDRELLRADFEIGQLIRDQIIPRAVLFFTGEAAADDDYMDDFEGDEDEVICQEKSDECEEDE
ncbi:unnamed protein product [Enterobius vermicularis]|uniref:Nucleosome assembly protein 1-like 1 n=1 Tax=Enterobius vermicularis TaxID=51028 RepID=A0A0N4V6C3_ENTVE|nr:unnamed protein product [Enterobius vermicularis]